jgi:hypothetical protein
MHMWTAPYISAKRKGTYITNLAHKAFHSSKDPNQPCFQPTIIYYNDYVLAGTDLAISTQGGHPIPEDLW